MTKAEYTDALLTMWSGIRKLSVCLWGTFTNAMCDTAAYFVKHPLNALMVMVVTGFVIHGYTNARTERDKAEKRAYAMEVSWDSLQTLIDLRH